MRHQLQNLGGTDWLRRLVLGLAGLSVALAAGVLFLGFDPIGQVDVRSVETVPVVFGLGVLGGVLIAIEQGFRRSAWLALGPALLGLVSLLENEFSQGSGLEAWLTAALTGEKVAAGGHMPMVAAVTLILIGGLLPWLVSQYHENRRLLALAIGGSLLGAIGITTLIGYSLNLLLGHRWGSSTNLPPVVALMMLLSGAAALLLAWSEHRQRKVTPPAWLPIPVILTCGMFTVVLWAGLREREAAYLGANAQFAINSLAGTVNAEFERQVASLERMARRWTADQATGVWESDALTWLADSPGAHSLARVRADGATAWYYPLAGNEHLIAFNQLDESARRATLDSVRLSGGPLVTRTLEIAGLGPGFIIYAPIYRSSFLVGYIGAEFTYQRFFEALDQRLLLSPNHRCAVYEGDQRLYVSRKMGAPLDDDPLVVESVFNLQNRRLRIAMEPSEESVRKNRRYLPELSLFAGLGITLLLGLSIHLARTARAGLVSVETTNKLLRRENDERRRVEAMLKVSDERLRLTLDATVVGIFEWDCHHNILHFSRSLWAMLGQLTGNEYTTPAAWQALIHPEDRPAYLAALQTQLTGVNAFIEHEYRVRTDAGVWRWLYMRSKIVAYSVAGVPDRIVGTFQDVTARREASQALLQSQAVARKLSLVASRTDNPVFIIKPDGLIEWVNDSFERVTEYAFAEVVGRDPASFTTGPETCQRTLRRIRSAVRNGRGISADIVVYSKSGRKYHVQIEIQPIRNEQGTVENFIAIESDITARVETENALRRAKTEADLASRAKSEFLASMSHEIRTPMNGVIGMTSLLLDSSLNDDQRDSVNTIRSSGEALLAIITDLLDFSKIESGKLELEHSPFDLAACVEETLDLFAGQAADRRIEVASFIDPAVPALVLGDANRIRQILANLINNAVKFTPAGSVSITVGLVDADETHPPLCVKHRILSIEVRDSGIGIPPESVERLFKPFSQVDSSTTRKYGGTGLGLAICHRLCVLMGGRIGVTSELNRGSTFTFTVQVEPAEDVDTAAPRLPLGLEAGPVLCVDDNPVSLAWLTAFFRAHQVSVLPAANAKQAAELLNGHRPVAAVLDLELAESAASAPVQAALLAADIPIIGLSLSSSSSIPEWTAQARFAAVSRPLRNFTLTRAFHALFPSGEPAPAPSPAPTQPLLATQIPLRVLLVEDNPVNQRVALRLLDRLGYQADAVGNGREALTAIEDRAYELVFMDLQMPEMDGFDAARHIRKNQPAHRQPCIIALTANALQSDRDACRAAGMNDFITKPIKLGDVDEVIRRNFPRSAPAA